MTFGLSPKQWKLLKEKVFCPLIKSNSQVFVFGSRARGDFKRFSDIDILVESTNADATRTLLSKINEDLEESNLSIKVDLVLLQDLAESYTEQVLRERKAIAI